MWLWNAFRSVRLKSLFSVAKTSNRKHRSGSRGWVPYLEPLEDRRLLALTVQFTSGNFAVPEKQGAVPITVQIYDPSKGSAAIALHPEIRVTYHTWAGSAQGSATPNVDYSDTSGTLVFPANSGLPAPQAAAANQQSFPVNLLKNADFDGNETVNLSLDTIYSPGSSTPPAQFSTNGNKSVLTITDSVPPPFNIGFDQPPQVYENQGNVTVTVVAQGLLSSAITVNFSTVSLQGANAAIPGTNYVSLSTSVMIPGGNYTATQFRFPIQITIRDDGVVSSQPLVFQVTLTDPFNRNLFNPSVPATVYILETDTPPPVISFGAPSYSFPEPSQQVQFQQVQIPVIIDAPPTGPASASVTYSVTANNAQELVDFQIVGPAYSTQTHSGTLTFPAGSSAAQNVIINLFTNPVIGGDKSFLITLTSPVNGLVIAPPPGANTTVTITKNPSPTVQFSLSNYAVNEGDGMATLIVTTSTVPPAPISVGFATSDDTAKAGVRYTAVAGNLLFTPSDPVNPDGTISKTIQVPILSTSAAEADQTFLVSLTVNQPVLGTPRQAVVTIHDTETNIPKVTINNAAVVEGGTSKPATIHATLSGVYPYSIDVPYTTVNGSTAIGGVDFASSSGTLHFVSGSTDQPFSVNILHDAAADGACKESCVRTAGWV
jgi:hypothetical protein